MINHKKVIVVLPAFNAVKTLQMTINDIPLEIIDEIILVDDVSSDGTLQVAKNLSLKTFSHSTRKGYGGNQKTCYQKALEADADIVVMVHPDHQYNPKMIGELIKPIINNKADAVFGSRMMIKKNALAGGMPLWKFVANITLTKIENFILGLKLTEYHSGFRAYSRKVLETLPLEYNSNSFVFDSEIIVQMKIFSFRIKEIPIQTKYFKDASQIGIVKSIFYGISILGLMVQYLLYKIGIKVFKKFRSTNKNPFVLK